ncbi:nucleotidyltransferase domain-containing protein [Candidatus Woesearchaeota archaeon]|nr:nucleotidyltransferase domain-containing protein [Candidatus Woesearchaeota archaeon]
MLIEPIFGYKSSWRILKLLFETPRKKVSRKELFEYTSLGNAPLSNGLNRLVKAGIIIKEKNGKKEFYYVNLDNEYTKLIKEIIEKEKKDIKFLDYDLYVILSEFLRMLLEVCDVDEVILFGSHAKGNASISSDIDIAVVFSDDLSGEIEVTKIVKKLESKFEKIIQVHFFTAKTFSKKSKLVNEIRRDGISLLR